MSIMTTCRLADPFGNHLIEIANYEKLHYVLNCAPGAIGVLELTLPTSFDTSLLLPDGRIGVWRSINGQQPYHDGNAIFLIEDFEYTAATTFVRAYHASTLLDRRIIAYAAGSTYADKAATAADDLIKTFVSENMLAGIVGADRDGAETQADVSAYLTAQANLTQGQTIAKAAARRILLDVARELAEASTTAGTYLTFEIMAPTESTLELRTYATVRGVDHRVGTQSPVILSEARGNLENAKLRISYRDETTFTIAGGTGEKASRLIATQLDTTRMGASPFGRKERFVDMSNVSDTAALQDEADAALWDGRPTTTVFGNLIETPATTRGLQFDLGDMLTVENPRTQQQFDVRLDVVGETIDSVGPSRGFALTEHQVQHRRTTAGLRSVS
jgi:hypothetical protein